MAVLVFELRSWNLYHSKIHYETDFYYDTGVQPTKR